MERLLCLVGVMDTGGAETFLMKMYRKLDKSKYQMDFCVNTNNKGFYDDEIREMGGMIFSIPCKSQDYKGFKQSLTKIVKKYSYTHILRISSNSFGFLDLVIAKKAGAEVCIARSSNSSEGGSISSVIANYLGRLLCQSSIDIKIAPSKKAAIHTFGKKAVIKGDVQILHNALDLAYYKYDLVSRDEVRKSMGLKDDDFVIGHIGRFTKQKNHKFLIEIFENILRLNKKSVLLLVGDGGLKKDIENMVISHGLSENVVFMGIRDDVPRILSAMDAFLFPSLFEGMPNTVIEAQATGLPCIISDTISEEADVSGLVSFMSLSDSPQVWAQTVLLSRNKCRCDVQSNVSAHGYDINVEVNKFVNIIFEGIK